MQSVDRQTYYVEREYALWPPHLTVEESMAVRRRLPTVGEGKTIRDHLHNRQLKGLIVASVTDKVEQFQREARDVNSIRQKVEQIDIKKAEL